MTSLSVDASLEEDEADKDVELECPDEATATGEEGVRGDAAKAVEATSLGRTTGRSLSKAKTGRGNTRCGSGRA